MLLGGEVGVIVGAVLVNQRQRVLQLEDNKGVTLVGRQVKLLRINTVGAGNSHNDIGDTSLVVYSEIYGLSTTGPCAAVTAIAITSA